MEKFYSLPKFCTTVQTLSGSALKSYVSRFKDVDNIKGFLRLVYDKRTYTYGVKPEQMYLVDADVSEQDWADLKDSLAPLASRRTTGAAAKLLASKLVDKYGIVAYSILNRKIPNAVLGLTTINKCIPGLIPDFKVAKAKDIQWDRVSIPSSAERKYDGNNLYIVEGKFFTREGHRVYLPILEAELANTPLKFSVLVAEVCIGLGKLGDRNKVQGLVTKGRKQTISLLEERSLVFYVFDHLTSTAWAHNKCTIEYEGRRESMEYLVNMLSSQYKIGYRKVLHSTRLIKQFLATELVEGYEGIVVKPVNHMYEFKRSYNWMRHKEMKTMDMRVIDYKLGTGKNECLLGSLLCKASYKGKTIEVNVGQGFSDIERNYSASMYIDKIIEVSYNEITAAGSLTIPLFMGIREDKEDAING